MGKQKYPHQFIMCPNCDTTMEVAMIPEINIWLEKYVKKRIREFLEKWIKEEDFYDETTQEYIEDKITELQYLLVQKKKELEEGN